MSLEIRDIEVPLAENKDLSNKKYKRALDEARCRKRARAPPPGLAPNRARATRCYAVPLLPA
eukprot:2307561-Pyramimonas_sp.AAC.1